MLGWKCGQVAGQLADWQLADWSRRDGEWLSCMCLANRPGCALQLITVTDSDTYLELCYIKLHVF